MDTLPQFDRQDGAPLYPKILYNRPVTRSGAGRLLAIGGHTGEFSLPTALYGFAMAGGAGECVVALPDRLYPRPHHPLGIHRARSRPNDPNDSY